VAPAGGRIAAIRPENVRRIAEKMDSTRSLALERDALLSPRSLAEAVFYVLCGAALLTASAQLRIPLGFTPVPVTGQTLALVLLGTMLGWRAGAAAAAAHVAAGFAGLPVFAGFSTAAGSLPTLGYLFAFPAGAATAGLVWSRRRSDSAVTAVAAGLACMGVVHLGGMSWLAAMNAFSTGISSAWWLAFLQGSLPFILVDAAKSVIAAALITAAHRAASGRGRFRPAA
jgi:biotin transport system substrate-specific component